MTQKVTYLTHLTHLTHLTPIVKSLLMGGGKDLGNALLALLQTGLLLNQHFDEPKEAEFNRSLEEAQATLKVKYIMM